MVNKSEQADSSAKKRRIFLIASASVLVAALVISIILITGSNYVDESRIVRLLDFGTATDGVLIGGVDISGMTKQQAREETKQLPEDLLRTTQIPFDIDGALMVYSAPEIGLTTDYESVLSTAADYGHTGSFDQRLEELRAAKSGEAVFDITITAAEPEVKAALTALYDVFNNDPIDASYEFMPNGYLEDGTPYYPDAFNGKAQQLPMTIVRIPDEEKPNPLRYQYWRKTKYVKDHILNDADIARFLYKEEEKGLNTDMEALASMVLDAVANADFSTIAVPVTVTEPAVTLEEVKAQTQLISSWTTWYGHSPSSNRHYNVGLLSSKINGTVLQPDVQWSINKDIGPRKSSDGFKAAGALVSGRTEDDIGGGVCQVASTLYNAAIRSDLNITMHSYHTIPSVYLPIALDAAISESPDLGLKNPYDVPVFIVSYNDFKNKNITFEIYGPPVVHETFGEIILDFTSVRTGRGSTPGTKYLYNQTITPDGKTVPANGEVVYRDPRAATYGTATKHYLDLTGKELKKEQFQKATYPSFTGLVYRNYPETGPLDPDGDNGDDDDDGDGGDDGDDGDDGTE